MVSDDAEAACALHHVEEAGELNQLVADVAASGGEAAQAAFPRFSAIVSWQGGPRASWAMAPAPRRLPPLDHRPWTARALRLLHR